MSSVKHRVNPSPWYYFSYFLKDDVLVTCDLTVRIEYWVINLKYNIKYVIGTQVRDSPCHYETHLARLGEMYSSDYNLVLLRPFSNCLRFLPVAYFYTSWMSLLMNEMINALFKCSLEHGDIYGKNLTAVFWKFLWLDLKEM
jgi:hypothetical protein